MATYNISLNDELDELVKTEMKRMKYANRSEFFRELVRKQYLETDYTIEAVDEGDPDYQIIQEEKKNAAFVSFEEFKAQL
ncbi:ribbon-helix-helix protein, CopG family [Candidatus Peregrinibacteria bacterium]|jgi:Arc/MetJ-type ribon-helix-helix transcriptional regulator|nr:ribbon-helix-helix protein, CopG family [Candidatus Peregrinibacteria bacterium]